MPSRLGLGLGLGLGLRNVQRSNKEGGVAATGNNRQANRSLAKLVSQSGKLGLALNNR